ncbi:MAG TPA: DNA polymerase/3'-5' exonuclease PolX [Syntrophorhabdaceae bacterium]|jgi:DNA polymerase (family 10)|nr:DNA polymerase/3'-5' exonuclease PolX [Syntrophorhabdaceae bacterium]HNQ62909.1 DNA polymerase/3'-5' exonuclease PolX [Syntrophorhabdaceae bacterium]HNZ59380.1 DNA polymerase/3'-5' exonuclease PolX [Syntrophorhabdaceae bacterium]HOB68620.1 DNA polymerase/3'-5' exonuclease PolX [Syntrophorhabdaceae bacterium]HOF57542.1 DNA polymerase/3'-5' exonuclease PolX [Syntrophorhabdaceae bacterium]
MSKSIIEILKEIGTLLEIKGENPFKTNAYFNAAKTLSVTENLDDIIKTKRLKQIKGIGEALSQKIEEYSETGRIAYYEELKKEIPPSLIELTAIPNLGPKKIKILYDELRITNAGELEYACKENRLVTLSGFGEKTQKKILKGIEFIKMHKGEFLYGDIFGISEVIRDRFKTIVKQEFVEICGSIRRKREVVKNVDILVCGEDRERLSSFFVSMPEIEEVTLKGDTKISCRLITGIEADLRMVSEAEFPFALLYFTGSKEHNIRLRDISKKKGWNLNEYGLFDGDNPIYLHSEEEIYRALNLSYIPPELREDMGEIEAAEEGMLPDLVMLDDIKGVFHIHTEFSDGMDSVEKMAYAAREMGFSYIGVSDHSKSAYYAGGLKVDDIYRQWEIIDELNESNKDFHIFKGIESDILPDGSLDYDEKILEGFDFVIASIHSNFNLKKDDQMKRILKAIENPYTNMLGHPTGRLLLSRDGYDVDMRTIIDAAAEYNVIIELNASPYRLDIDWRHLRYAKEKGVLISINPDAHSAGGLIEVLYGIGIARKGWQEKKDILNTRTILDIKDIFKNKRL